MVKKTLSLLFLAFPLTLVAEDDDPSPLEWYKKIEPELYKSSKPIFRRARVAKEAKKKKSFSRVIKSFNSKSFLQLVPDEVLEYPLALNPALKNEDLGRFNQGLRDYQLIFSDLGNKIKLTLPKNGVLSETKEWSIKEKQKLKGESAAEWFSNKIGYHGIVLDVKEDLILVGLYAPKADASQGIVIKGAESKLILESKKTPEVKALVQKEKIEGSVGTFIPLVGKDGNKEPMVVGDKILFKKAGED